MPVPASVVLEWMGFPRAEWEWFWTAFHGVSAHPNGTPEHRKATEAYADVMTRITEELRDRVRAPRDDALTTIAMHEVHGARITEDVARSIAFLTVTGGIDTTTSFTGAALLHLVQHPDDRARLLGDPDAPAGRDRGVPPLLPTGPHARTHRRSRHRVRGRGDEAGRTGPAERGCGRTRRVGVPPGRRVRHRP